LRQNQAELFFVHAWAREDAGFLRGTPGHDAQGYITVAFGACFEQKGDFENRGKSFGCARFLQEGLFGFFYEWVNDFLQPAQFFGLAENSAAKKFAVNSSALQRFRKQLCHGNDSCAALFQRVVCGLVGIKNRKTEIMQDFRCGAFAHADAACQADDLHESFSPARI
jgi:hypothetical protein